MVDELASTDLVCDVVRGLAISRVRGVWEYTSVHNKTKQEIINELRLHAEHLKLRYQLMIEAANGLEGKP